jgi:DNA-directed RNA polymerase subunit RPC12/RpoP
MDTEKEHRCLRCGHEWNSRCPDGESFKTWKPVICPHCKSPYWNKKSRNQKESLS